MDVIVPMVKLNTFSMINHIIMIQQVLPLVNWSNGIIMIAVFALVSIALVTALLLFFKSGAKKDMK